MKTRSSAGKIAITFMLGACALFPIGSRASQAAFTDLPDTPPLALPLREFPNPFSDHLYITVPDGLRGNTRAELCDEAGRSLIQWPLGFSEGAGATITLDTPDLPAGVYVLRLTDEWGDHGELTLYCE